MGATHIKIDLSIPRKLTKKQIEFQEKLLKGPTMTQKEIKEFEKRYPWLRKIKD